MTQPTARGFGLYLHFPFCDAICHYCDFAKTALHDPALRHAYLLKLEEHLNVWTEWRRSQGDQKKFSSVFLGGGTPSLFAQELAPLFARLSHQLADDAEITLEANPNHVNESHCNIWRSLGVNRISIGVQTFSVEGLRFLTRQHSPEQAIAAIETAQKYFPTVNVDLIYGWQNQTLEEWRRDLQMVTDLNVPHLSLYNLIVEEGTVFGRRRQRQLLPSPPDELEWQMFRSAQEHLGQQGFAHEEVSNWSWQGHSCRHNWLYWQGDSYLGLGVGAHSFLPTQNPWGVRFSVDRKERLWTQTPAPQLHELDQLLSGDVAPALIAVDKRGLNDWITELVLTGMRTTRGVPLVDIEKMTGRKFSPTPSVQEDLNNHRLTIENGFLKLAPALWFQEQDFCIRVLEGF